GPLPLPGQAPGPEPGRLPVRSRPRPQLCPRLITDAHVSQLHISCPDPGGRVRHLRVTFTKPSRFLYSGFTIAPGRGAGDEAAGRLDARPCAAPDCAGNGRSGGGWGTERVLAGVSFTS